MQNLKEQQEEFSFKNYFVPFTTVKAIHWIVIVGLILFFNGLFNGFIGDDQPQIIGNPLIQSLRNLPFFFTGSTFYNGSAQLGGVYYKPLLTTFFSLTYTIFGANAFGFHLFQILLYITNVCLLFFVLKKFFNNILAFYLSLIFLVHPINSETVFYISNTQEVLFFFFGISALFILQRYQSQKALVSASILLLASLLSKETGILFFCIAIIFIIFFKRKYLYAWSGYSVSIIVIYLLLRISGLGISNNITAYTPIDRLSLVGRLLNVPAIFLFYLKTFIYPVNLSISWRWAYTQIDFVHFYFPLLIDMLFLLFVFSFAFFLYKKARHKYFIVYMFFMLWFLLGMLLHIQIIPLDATVAERWFYFPLVGLLGMIGVLLEVLHIDKKQKILFVFVAVIVLLFSERMIVRSFNFRDEYTIDRNDLMVSKNDYNLENNLSVIYFNENKFSQAKAFAQESIASFPNMVNYTSLGAIDFRVGDYKDAKVAFLQALRFGDYYQTYANYTGMMLFYGDRNENIHFLQNIALRKYPQDGMMWADLAVLDYDNGDKNNAKIAIMHAATYLQTPLVGYIYNVIMNNKPLHLKYSNGQITVPGSS